MATLKVKFDDPDARWITISFSDGSDGSLMRVATFFSSFEELTTALTGLMDERADFVVNWLEEPDFIRWSFAKRDGLVTFDSRYVDSPNADFVFTGSYEAVCLPFWRALRGLEGRFLQEELTSRLGPFPFDALARLTGRVESMKAAPYRDEGDRDKTNR